MSREDRHSKGTIDSSGQLFIKRGNRIKAQSCRFSSSGFDCSDSCPLFQEPLKGYATTTVLKICQDTHLIFDKFEDMRGTE